METLKTKLGHRVTQEEITQGHAHYEEVKEQADIPVICA